MKIKLKLIAEIEVENVMEARRNLDAFRESVLPSENYGISLYEDHSEVRQEGCGCTCLECRIGTHCSQCMSTL